MKCRSCGGETPAEAVFCPACGERLQESLAPDSQAGEASAADRLRHSLGSRQEDEEKPVWEGGYCGKAMIGSFLGGALLSVAAAVACFAWLSFSWALLVTLLVALLIWGALGLRLLYRKLSVWYDLTTQRFIHKKGVLRRVTDRLEVIDIDDVIFTQGIVQRMMGVGTIRIVSSDRSCPDLSLLGIDQVKHVAELIDDVRRKERRRRGLHIESI